MDCKNCKTPLKNNYGFCYECGAKVITKRLTLKSILQNFSEQFFNYDSAMFKTFGHLFTKPEVVIGGYINGVRKRYLNVIQFLAISLTITGLQFFILNTFFENPFEFKPEDFGIPDDLPNKNSVSKIYEDMSVFMNKYFSLVYLISIPISAFGSWLTYKLYQKKYNYTEHLVINTYYAAQLLIVLAILGVTSACFGMSYMDFSLYSMPLSFIYFWFVIKRLYKQNLIESLAYLIIFVAFYFIAFILLGFLGGIIGVFIGLLIK